jgi:hypothetical protein
MMKEFGRVTGIYRDDWSSPGPLSSSLFTAKGKAHLAPLLLSKLLDPKLYKERLQLSDHHHSLLSL